MVDAPEGFRRKGDLKVVPQEVELAFLVGGMDADQILRWVRDELDEDRDSWPRITTDNFLTTIEMWMDRRERALERLHEYNRLRALKGDD